MKNEYKYIDGEGKELSINVISTFIVPIFEKEYAMCSIVDNDPNNEDGHIILGEVVRNENFVEVIGIRPEEKETVKAFYEEIKDKLGVI